MCKRASWRSRRLARPVREWTLWPAVLVVALAMSGLPTAGQEFAPFVIPARIDSGNDLWVSDVEPIAVESPRLRADRHFLRNQRVRIWGVNLSFGANFPTHQDAPHVAERLAASGVNSVRCHHMDTSRWPRGIWNEKDGRTIEPQALDRLDFFINELAQRGIWVNINLHVGRAHSPYLGLPETNSNYDKVAGIFTPALIDAQKQYARDLLGHVNPYRKVRYADDPAVAFVEITNEDSFFMWNGDETLRTLPPFYEEILCGQFNGWLKRRYTSDNALRTAWSRGTTPLGGNLLRNSGFDMAGTETPQHWVLERHAGCRATISRRQDPPGAIEIQISKADETEWHLQLNQRGLALKQGQYYTVSFDVSSNRARTISCGVSQAHEPWANLGLSRRLELTDQWTHCTFGFVATADDDNARISFAFSGDDAPVNLTRVAFHPGGQVALAKSESLSAGNVALFQANESEPRILDRMVFLAETEKAYFDEMRRFIKEDLGCDALVTGTIVFGPLGLYAQSDMDFIDAHAYWQHPRFPGRPWDQGNWLVEQKPMTDHPEQATLFRIAAERLAGKPFTVSEYNHPAPMDAQAECVPMMASFAAAQDWDGVWFYTYSHSGDAWDRQTLSSFFDVDTNPAKWGFMRAGATIFRQTTTPLTPRPVIVGSTEPGEPVAQLARLHARYGSNMLGVLAHAEQDVTYESILEHICLPVYPSHSSVMGGVGRGRARLHWSVDGDGHGLYRMTAPAVRVYTGHAGRFARETNGTVRLEFPAFVALTVTSLDRGPLTSLEASTRILVTACGRCENTGMQFSQDRRTVGRNWGQAPVQIEMVEGQVALPEGRWTCQALAPDGTPKQRVPMDGNVLKLAPEYGTMWYLLQRQAR